MLLLDAQNGLVAAHHVSTGTLSASLVHPREVFGPALRFLGVASVVLVHNHPSVIGSGNQDYASLAATGAC
jgi:DNA repair protein RadC